MEKNKIYKSDDIVEANKKFYTVHSHTDEKELLGREHRGGELHMVKVKDITRHWSLVEQ